MVEDYLLAPIGTIKKNDGKPYTVFTPFKNAGFKIQVAKPNKKTNFSTVKFKNELDIPELKIKNFFSKK